MALSVFLRNPACISRAFSQQLTRMVSQPMLAHHTLAKALPVTTIGFKDSTTPITDAIRSVKTSATQLQGTQHGHEHPHDHAKLWVIEKAVSGMMIPLIPAALLFPNKILDSVIAVLIVAHSFWGLEAIAVDYVRESLFGKIIPKIAIGIVYAICIATLGGLLYITYHDIGIANTVKNFWAIKSGQKA